MDHAGLPLKAVLEQLDLLGEEVVPVLRKEFANGRPADVPDVPDTRCPGRRRGLPEGRDRRMKLVAVSAGLSIPSSTRRLVDRLAEAVHGELATRDLDVETEVVELREPAVAVANNLATGFPPPPPAAAIDAVTGAAV